MMTRILPDGTLVEYKNYAEIELGTVVRAVFEPDTKALFAYNIRDITSGEVKYRVIGDVRELAINVSIDDLVGM